ncbi:hypothetical protein PIB30_085483 [Stylosanthes scabra]|uniref:NB-ARC domain-containing protein n=1 Tax=Stylosanthes scabra TaxID=79078 RepID=A0ABU6XTG5_9FABA|nr:hypothetical protein [Stylosanthes scabra]
MLSSSSTSAQTKRPHHLCPQKGLSGFSSVPDHRSTGRNPQPHHGRTLPPLPQEGVLALELWLLDREEQPEPSLLFNCIFGASSQHHNLSGDDNNGIWGLGFEACLVTWLEAKLRQNFTFATSLKDLTTNTATVHGRDEDKKKAINFLLDSARTSDSLSIVGLGGVGKTTLAQLIYNDEQITAHFNLKLWVCVSENFNVKGILSSIVKFTKKEKFGELTLAMLEQEVQALLRGKKFLLVLDDVWIEYQGFYLGLSLHKWNQLFS